MPVVVNGVSACHRFCHAPSEPRASLPAPAPQVLGQRDVPVVVGGAVVCPGDWLYADEGGTTGL